MGSLASQVLSDVIASAATGNFSLSSWQTYAGAVAGGAAGGAVYAATKNSTAAGAASGFVSTFTTGALEKTETNRTWGDIVAESVNEGLIGAKLGKAGDRIGIKGKTTGRNSWAAVYKSGPDEAEKWNSKKNEFKGYEKGVRQHADWQHIFNALFCGQAYFFFVVIYYMEMRKSESVNKQLSYKPAIIELVELSATSLFTIYRIQILSFFGIHMRKFCLVDKLLCCVLMFLMLYFFDQLILDFFNIHEKRKKLKGDKRGCAEFKGKQYSLEEISKMLRESDIIEIDIKTATDIITIGASSDCEQDEWKFFDKSYYIEDKKYGLEQEKQLLDDIRYMCGGESITVLEIDGIKAK